MSRYGQIRETGESTQEFKVREFLNSMDMQLGNGGLSRDTQAFLRENSDQIEDAFIGEDGMYLLPATREFATLLYNQILGKHYDPEEDYGAEADEVEWYKVDNRYWLSLWWD